MKGPSWMGQAYKTLYDKVAGRHPYQRPWHHQWVAVSGLHKELKNLAPQMSGAILDLGCGNKPYKTWFTGAVSYLGVDISDGAEVDLVIEPRERLPLRDESFDVVVALEVLEHVQCLGHTLSEIQRLVKPGGRVIISVPFLYNEHGAPGDFRRLTKFSASGLFPDSFKLNFVKTLGGIGSTLSILTLNWLEASANRNKTTRLAKGALLPIWMMLSFGVNMLGSLLDFADRTDSYYHHILMVLEKN